MEEEMRILNPETCFEFGDIMGTCSDLNGSGPLESYGNQTTIATPRMTMVFWGDWSNYHNGSVYPLQDIQDEIVGFVPQFAQSAISNKLSQYSFKGITIDPKPLLGGPVGSTMDEIRLGMGIEKSVANNTLPKNTAFLHFFPPETDVREFDGESSCAKVNAYHDITSDDTGAIPYGVFPFPCDFRNRTSFTKQDFKDVIGNYTVAISHEFEEMCLKYKGAYGWTATTQDGRYTECSDLCANCNNEATLIAKNGKQYPVASFFSNEENDCWPKAGTCVAGNLTYPCPPNSTSVPTPTASSSVTPETPTPTNLPSSSNSSPLGAGGIAGLTVEGVVTAGVVGAAAYLSAKKYPNSAYGKFMRNNPVSRAVKSVGYLWSGRGANPAANLEAGNPLVTWSQRHGAPTNAPPTR